MGLYTKKVKEAAPVKEVKKKGRPKKVVQVEAAEPDVEPPKVEEPVAVEKEQPKEPEKVEPQIPREKTPPPPEPVQVEEPLLKKPTPKKKEVKKVEKKVSKPKEDEEPPSWFKKFLSQGPLSEMGKTKPETDFKKEAATKLWNDRVKPKSQTNPSGNYDSLYKQMFGR